MIKIGDRIKLDDYSHYQDHRDHLGEVAFVTGVTAKYLDVLWNDNRTSSVWFKESEPYKISDKEQKVGRRTFKLLKDLPDYKKGLLVQEACDDGDQQYVSINGDEVLLFDDHLDYFETTETVYSRDGVENNPKWFVEVFPATLAWLTKEELASFKAWSKKKGNK